MHLSLNVNVLQPACDLLWKLTETDRELRKREVAHWGRTKKHETLNEPAHQVTPPPFLLPHAHTQVDESQSLLRITVSRKKKKKKKERESLESHLIFRGRIFREI